MTNKIARNLAIIIATLAIFFYWQNNDITVTNIDFENTKIPNNFNGYKILQVSDLHNKKFGKNQKKLVQLTKEINPDIIVITGDIVDSRRTNVDVALQYINQAVKIAPTYYVQGNHESRIEEYTKLEEGLLKAGVKILDNKNEEINIDNQKINLIGMEDLTLVKSDTKRKTFEEILKTLKSESVSDLNILLSHRPELLYIYARQGIDLVFAGHAHGGQIRLPFTDGLFAPGQGILPKSTSGVHKDKNTEMVVSRGLGNSLFPFRVFNRPELVVTTLKVNS
ncbi:metallophosphoesterase [Romboutsia sp.]|uniref:metallophosphoesterase n=1 Tax=Romboutsia sp. TaxID=1965302 RepID=UPI003F3C92CD